MTVVPVNKYESFGERGMSDLSRRSTEEVFEDHLSMADEGRLEDDIARNCAEDIVLLTNDGVFRGHDGVREAAALLERELPDGTYEYVHKIVHGEMAFLVWTGDSSTRVVRHGADSFLIRNGKIRVMTIYFLAEDK